jgi:hypothetical protein
VTTRAMGEEGGEAPVPNLIDLEKLAAAGGMGMMATTQAVGEEEGDIGPTALSDLSTLIANRPSPGVAVTRALGEMPDGSINPAFEANLIASADLSSLSPVMMATTQALGEDGAINPAFGGLVEESLSYNPNEILGSATTMAIGEMPDGSINPMSLTQAIGEQPGDIRPDLDVSEMLRPAGAVTRALGEMPDGSIDPAFSGSFINTGAPLSDAMSLTQAVGEQEDIGSIIDRIRSEPLGAGGVTTMAVGEEGDPVPPTQPAVEAQPSPQPPAFDQDRFNEYMDSLTENQRTDLFSNYGYSPTPTPPTPAPTPANPFEDVPEYQALLEYKRGGQELVDAFKATDAFKDFDKLRQSYSGGIADLARPIQQPMQQSPFGGGMNNNSMSLLLSLLSQVFSGGGMGGGFSPYGNSGGGFYGNGMYGGQPSANNQQAIYGQPQPDSPFGGATRGYYA